MNRSTRTSAVPVALALLALAALGALAGCSAGSSTASPSAVASALSTPATGAASGPPPTPTPGSEVQRLTLTVRGDSVTGDTGTVDVRIGRPVELTVTSDVADEVHVHGVDLGKDVPAGGTVVLDFTQGAPGRFEVELEQRRRVLTRLQVS